MTAMKLSCAVIATAALTSAAAGGDGVIVTVTPVGGTIGKYFSNEYFEGHSYNFPGGGGGLLAGDGGEVEVTVTPVGGTIGEYFSNEYFEGHSYNFPGGGGAGPVPAPGTLVVLGTGALLGLRRRRRD